MSEIIERVARAAYFAGEGIGIQGAFNPANDAHWAHWWQEDRELHEAIARAAIEAMREPTDGMLRAAVPFPQHLIHQRSDPTYTRRMEVATTVDRLAAQSSYQTMIDAALAAPPVEQAKTEVVG